MAFDKRALYPREKYGLGVLAVIAALALFYGLYDKNVRGALQTRHDFLNPDRLVHVLILADRHFFENQFLPGSEELAEEILENSSRRYFESVLGIRFAKCGFQEFDKIEVARLESFDKGACDIIVAFTGKPIGIDSGHTEKGVGIVIVSTHYAYRVDRLLAHELAHIFGAWHLRGRKLGYFMHEQVDFWGDKLDNRNWHIMMFYKYRDFR